MLPQSHTIIIDPCFLAPGLHTSDHNFEIYGLSKCLLYLSTPGLVLMFSFSSYSSQSALQTNWSQTSSRHQRSPHEHWLRPHRVCPTVLDVVRHIRTPCRYVGGWIRGHRTEPVVMCISCNVVNYTCV